MTDEAEKNEEAPQRPPFWIVPDQWAQVLRQRLGQMPLDAVRDLVEAMERPGTFVPMTNEEFAEFAAKSINAKPKPPNRQQRRAAKARSKKR